MRTQNKARYNL